MGSPKSQWLKFSVALALASLSASTTISIYFWRRKLKSILSNREANRKIQQLEAALKGALENCAAERQGRIRAQQALREGLSRSNNDKLEPSLAYPMAPIGVVHSCFSTRNGTPRQPLLVPLAKASLIFDSSRVPPASLEGLEGYSHCWIIYVFHLNTNMEKLWKHPSQSKFKAKVRVPKLQGEKIGVFATRSPHRPCPIGLTVAKLVGYNQPIIVIEVEAVDGHMVLLSGVDLVDGTPVLDIKPYLPYCDNVQGATVPEWVKVDNVLAIASVNFSECFASSLANCWSLMEKKSLYASPEEFQSLIKQVLSWDIRSLSQRSRPNHDDVESKGETFQEDEHSENGGQPTSALKTDVVYHLILGGIDVSYRIDSSANVLVENVAPTSNMQ